MDLTAREQVKCNDCSVCDMGVKEKRVIGGCSGVT